MPACKATLGSGNVPHSAPETRVARDEKKCDRHHHQQTEEGSLPWQVSSTATLGYTKLGSTCVTLLQPRTRVAGQRLQTGFGRLKALEREARR